MFIVNVSKFYLFVQLNFNNIVQVSLQEIFKVSYILIIPYSVTI